jgi:uncharacterized membrane protein
VTMSNYRTHWHIPRICACNNPRVTQPTPATTQSRSTIVLAVVAAIGVLFAFISTVSTFNSIEALGKAAKLVGADSELNFPSSAFVMALMVAVLAIAVADLAGARVAGGVWTALVPLSLVTLIFTLWSLYLHFDWLMLIEVVAAAGAFALIVRRMPRTLNTPVLGVFLVVAGLVGFFAAFRLTVDKIGTYINPPVALSCDVSPIVQCGKNLASAQGAVFGFPNPLLGVGGWIAVILVGILVLTGASFARWFWIAFNVGVAGALVLVIWLISQSVFVLGTLCPWCMVTWAVTIPVFLLVTLNNGKNGRFGGGDRSRRVFGNIYGWVPIITFACYLAIAVIAQVHFDLLSYL